MSARKPNRLPTIADFPPEQVNPAVLLLLEVCHQQHAQIQDLRDEIARMKGGNPKPPIKPSKLPSQGTGSGTGKGAAGRGKNKRSKTQRLEIHDEVVVPPAAVVPAGSRFKGYEDFTVQDLRIEARNTRYRLERWVTPAGETLRGEVPDSLGGTHFGATLRAFVLHQYHHAHVTQPLLLEQLRQWGVEISAGQLSRLITEPTATFHDEKEALLRAGLQCSDSVHVDDTGARHRGRNGYCTHIGNERFAFFASTASKSRINFLELLRAGDERYVIDAQGLAHMRAQGLPKGPLAQLADPAPKTITDRDAWQATLAALAITDQRHVRIATEGALLGAVSASGINPDLVVVSDDAGQFDVLTHALCWVHAERGITSLLGFNDEQRAALAWARGEIWEIYRILTAYKVAPDPEARVAIEARFETLCTTRTCFESLNRALKRLRRSGAELLRVLDHPGIALHNNLSERDIRDYVKKRKISGSTRSDNGRQCRDTFASLKKTCRKQRISFWDYLLDRLGLADTVPWLPSAIFGVGRGHPAAGP